MSENADSRQPMASTVKPPVYLQIGHSTAGTAHSGVCVLDVSPPVGKPVSIEEVTFKNYYTAYLTVRLLRRSPEQNGLAKWCTAVRDLPLMDNPHTEGGSQDYYSIHRTQVGHSGVEMKTLIHNIRMFWIFILSSFKKETLA
uniref:Uncharacterized protein n=1 Tax=Kryptolebias marmoratus TaxID=37003 RepID=A0A3Q3B115_KRYMA